MISKEELNNFYDKIKSLIKEEMNRWVNLDMHKEEWDPVTIWTHSSVNKILYDEFLLLSKDENGVISLQMI